MIAHEARENTINVGVLWQLVESTLIATLVCSRVQILS
jgi:hypothetical protein